MVQTLPHCRRAVGRLLTHSEMFLQCSCRQGGCGTHRSCCLWTFRVWITLDCTGAEGLRMHRERRCPHFICRPASPEGMVFRNQAHIGKVVRGCAASSTVKSSALPTQNAHLRCKPMLLRHRTGLQHKPARMPHQGQNTSIARCEWTSLKGLQAVTIPKNPQIHPPEPDLKCSPDAAHSRQLPTRSSQAPGWAWDTCGGLRHAAWT